MRDHHALRPGRRAGGVVDAQQVRLRQPRIRRRRRRLRRDQRLVVLPAGQHFVRLEAHRHVALDGRQLVAQPLHGRRVVRVHHRHLRPRVAQHVLEVRRDQAVVDRHDAGPDRGRRVQHLQELVAVGAEDRDPIALADAERQQRVRQLVHPRAELGVGEAQLPVDHGLLPRIELDGPAQKIVDDQRDFHRRALLTCGGGVAQVWHPAAPARKIARPCDGPRPPPSISARRPAAGRYCPAPGITQTDGVGRSNDSPGMPGYRLLSVNSNGCV